jgi:hypothetical protein
MAGIACALAVPAAAQINYPDFSQTSGLTFNGASAAVNNGVDAAPVVRLVPASFNNGGSTFASGAVCVSGFSSQFQFRITGAGPVGSPDAFGQVGADGLTLTLARGPNALGGFGGGLGYDGLTPSVAVEFDTWFNAGFDPDSNHVGINVNGSFASVIAQPVAGRFDDGSLWTAWVDYDGLTLEVRVNNTGVRPAVANVSLPIDIPAVLGSATAFAGFTASTGAAFGSHDIVNWMLDEQCGNVIIDGCDTGVTDHRLSDGSLFSIAVQACAINSTTHGGFVSCVAALGNQSMRAGSISGRQRGAIQSCAARASYYTGPVRSGEFIVNGGFETGDATGWRLTASNGAWTVNAGTFDPRGPAVAQPPIDGNFDLVSDQGGANLNRAIQTLSVPLELHSATLTWSDRLNSAAAWSDPGQEYRVVIRALDLTPIAEVFSTSAGDAQVQLGPNARSANLTAALQALKGQTVLISFEQQATSNFVTLTLDKVSLQMTYR